jgi:predicted nucleic acid-binding protein
MAKRAGELLKHARGKDAMDAIIVALAERTSARRIYTSDVVDIERLLSAASDWGCESSRSDEPPSMT